MALFDTEKRTIVQEKKLPFKIEFISRYQNSPVAFDRQGQMHIIKSFSNIETSKVPFKGQVTAFAESKNQHIQAYGMNDGTINIINGKGEKIRLVGHLSHISKVKVDGGRLYSSSYDGTLNLWLYNSAKIEPMTLFTTRGWIINFTFDLKKSGVWSGDQNGNLTEALISVTQMQERLKNKLKRNLTREEWNYYIGRNVPYENIK
jgi:WD40 repeat protein